MVVVVDARKSGDGVGVGGCNGVDGVGCILLIILTYKARYYSVMM